jgi:hypothetical protein
MFVGITTIYSEARYIKNLCGSLVEGVEGWTVTKKWKCVVLIYCT